MSREQWKPVIGWEGHYEVSDQGRVRSLPRVLTSGPKAGWSYGGKVLKLHPNEDGYLEARLIKRPRREERKVHRLVFESFKHVLAKGETVDHKDRRRANNAARNLRAASISDNQCNSVACRSKRSRAFRGVSFHKASGKWQVRLDKNYRAHHLGLFSTFGKAVAARKRAEKPIFGRFAPQRK